MNLYCKACAKIPIDLINQAIEEAKEKLAGEKVETSDVKSKAGIFKAAIKDAASAVAISLS